MGEEPPAEATGGNFHRNPRKKGLALQLFSHDIGCFRAGSLLPLVGRAGQSLLSPGAGKGAGVREVALPSRLVLLCGAFVGN